MANPYAALTAAMVTALSGLSGYTALVVEAKIFKPNDLGDFDRYKIVVSPNGMPWEERRIGVALIEYTMRHDLWLLVKNWHESDSLFGQTAGSLGLFELIDDVKDLIRISAFGGLTDRSTKTYDEPAGPLNFESSAVAAFDTGEKAWIHRARLVSAVRLTPFCHARLP